ncbi:sugar transferase [Enterococcus hirae]|nr:sugar transferase [Enterococcus hirae]
MEELQERSIGKMAKEKNLNQVESLIGREADRYAADSDINELYTNYQLLKRFFDIIGSLFALIVFSPILLIVWLIIKISDPHDPAIFAQKRIGKDGQLFTMYKFRSMVPHAVEFLKKHPKFHKAYVENDYKFPEGEDPRVTKIDAFMRKTSIDELPQFINVLKGDMSLVGPRPVVDEELAEYGDKKEMFLSMKPGITGVWQTSGRSSIGYPERVDLELSYRDNHSIMFDINILFMTVVKVFKSEGAY